MKRMTFYLGMALAVLSLASCRNGGKSIITPVSCVKGGGRAAFFFGGEAH